MLDSVGCNMPTWDELYPLFLQISLLLKHKQLYLNNNYLGMSPNPLCPNRFLYIGPAVVWRQTNNAKTISMLIHLNRDG